MFKKKVTVQQSTKAWLPIENISNGIVKLKSGELIKILEVQPINFKLKSKLEKRSIVLNYREFLKACHFPMQISIQCRKADIEAHLKNMEGFLKNELNENARLMSVGYISLIRTLAKKGSVSRRFFLVIPYISPPGSKCADQIEVEKQLAEKSSNITEYLKQCGNSVFDATGEAGTEFILQVIYSFLNKRNFDAQKYCSKLSSLTGIMVSGVD